MLLIRDVEVRGQPGRSVRVDCGRIVAVADRGALRPRPGEQVLDGRGGALLPGLHDHHLHLLALAAASESVRCGPPEVRDRVQLIGALRQAASSVEPGTWLRGVGYHESVAGWLDRATLDELAPPGHPVRLQHRSGALWVLNSEACDRLGLRAEADGRLFRQDAWLRQQLRAIDADAGHALTRLTELGRRLATFGVTGVTDATADNGCEELALFRRACADGALPQRVLVMGSDRLSWPVAGARLSTGPLKIVLDEDADAAPARLAVRIGAAHRRGRRVAAHCVTRAGLVLALAAWEDAGVIPGDRVEHAAVAPPELAAWTARLGLTVVTQPGLVAARGDQYREDVDPEDLPWLWRAAGLAAAGIPIAAGTDAPFGDPDPWQAIRAAVTRTTEDGAVLGPEERLTPERALSLFTGPAVRPGGASTTLEPGAPADLCLLAVPWREARGALCAALVTATIVGGQLVHVAEGASDRLS